MCFYVSAGCGWPVVHEWTIPAEASSGFHRVVSLVYAFSPFYQGDAVKALPCGVAISYIA